MSRRTASRYGSPRLQNTALEFTAGSFARGLVPRHLAESADPDVRRLYSLWSDTQHEWAATGYDPDLCRIQRQRRVPRSSMALHRRQLQGKKASISHPNCHDFAPRSTAAASNDSGAQRPRSPYPQRTKAQSERYFRQAHRASIANSISLGSKMDLINPIRRRLFFTLPPRWTPPGWQTEAAATASGWY